MISSPNSSFEFGEGILHSLAAMQDSALRKLVVVPTVRVDEPQEHHCVVLMDQVVTVHRVMPVEVTEAEEEFIAIVVLYSCYVVAPLFRGRRCCPIAAEQTVLLKVDVDGVLPIARKVGENPVFGGVKPHPHAYFRAVVVAVHEYSIDGPLAIQAVKVEGAADARGLKGREVIELHETRVAAVVFHFWQSNVNAYIVFALAGG